MNTTDEHHFYLLKQAIAQTFLSKNHAPNRIEDWKGEDISQFQEDLFDRVRGQVSEKWFYTYIKKQPEKLPRIDMLNLLSKYVGHENWNAFRAAYPDDRPSEVKKGYLKLAYIILIILFLSIALYTFLRPTENEFNFCMVDEEGAPIVSMVVDVKILQENQSPIYLKTDSLGCFEYKTMEESIQFVLKSPYHKTDTIVRHIGSGSNKNVPLLTDHYTLMLRYYSSGNVTDWNKRRAQLNDLIAEDAQIYQVFKPTLGIELYSKADFIRKMTIPTSSLKNIKVLDKKYRNGKIVTLKFIVE